MGSGHNYDLKNPIVSEIIIKGKEQKEGIIILGLTLARVFIFFSNTC
jgi:hypothetical protein